MAVFTPLTDDAIATFLQDYDIGTLQSWHGIVEGVENSNFMLDTSQGRYILTLFEARTNPDDVPFFLALMQHYAAAGIPCPAPILARDGAALRTLKRKPAIIISFLSGVWPKHPTLDMVAQVGDLLGRMHNASAAFALQKPNRMNLPEVNRLLQRCLPQADAVEPGLAALITTTLDEVANLWPTILPTGAIHADLFPDNVFFLNGRISGVIDFYFAGTDMLALDVAIALNAWCFEGTTFIPAKAEALLAAYQRHRPFSEAERAAFGRINQFACLRFLATRLHDWLFTDAHAVVMKKDPKEYIAKLRFHWQQAVL